MWKYKSFFQIYYQRNTDLTFGKHLLITEPPRHVLNTLLVPGDGINLAIRTESQHQRYYLIPKFSTQKKKNQNQNIWKAFIYKEKMPDIENKETV